MHFTASCQKPAENPAGCCGQPASHFGKQAARQNIVFETACRELDERSRRFMRIKKTSVLKHYQRFFVSFRLALPACKYPDLEVHRFYGDKARNCELACV